MSRTVAIPSLAPPRVRALLTCGLAALAACSGDPTLAITVHHPAGLAIAQTVVTVYFGGGITCDQVALGDRTEAELAAITVDEVDVTDGGRVEVSRLGAKSVAARGYDDQHRFLAAGCEDVGEIAGATKVAIDTRTTATVAIDPAQPDRPFSERTLLVNITDPGGTPLDTTVSWLLSGPAGAAEQQPSAPIATEAGNARIQIADLGVPGPAGLRIRVPWSTAPVPLVTGFDLSGAMTVPLGGGNVASHPSCDVRGHAGQPATLVCLTQANAQLHRDVVEIAWQTDRYVATTIPVTAGDGQFALLVDRDGSADEPVYVLGANALGVGSWYRLGADAATSVVFGGALDNAFYIPRCKHNATTALVAVQTRTAALQTRQLFTPAGASALAAQDGEIFSGGCVADADQQEHQAVVISNAAGDAGLVLLDGTRQIPIAVARLTGSGFVAAVNQGTVEQRFVGTRLQATGTVIFEAVLAPEGDSFKLVERTELEAAAPPSKIVGGKLDRDGDTDLMWDIAASARRRIFQVSLAKQVSGVPLTAITSGPLITGTALPPVTDFITGDLDGKGTDEMILFTQSTATIYSLDR